MSVTYAIFEAEFRTAFRKNVQGLKKRIAGTFFIFFMGLIFSFACIRLIKFVIDNPELFPEGSNEGYGTILLIFFALFTLRTAGLTYRKIIKSKRMDLYLVQPITPRKIMLGMCFSILIPNTLSFSFSKNNVSVSLLFIVLIILNKLIIFIPKFFFS